MDLHCLHRLCRGGCCMYKSILFLYPCNQICTYSINIITYCYEFSIVYHFYRHTKVTYSFILNYMELMCRCGIVYNWKSLIQLRVPSNRVIPCVGNNIVTLRLGSFIFRYIYCWKTKPIPPWLFFCIDVRLWTSVISMIFENLDLVFLWRH